MTIGLRVLALGLALTLPGSAFAQGSQQRTAQPDAAYQAQQSLQPSAASAYEAMAPAAAPSDGDNVPVPDPSDRTVQQLYREILLARQANSAEVEALRKVLETRLDAIDTATDLRIKPVEELSTVIKDAITNLQALQDEKFHSIAVQFSERDIRQEKADTQSKTAIDAALQAQEKSVNDKNESNAQAIAKSEAGFTKQIDGLRDQNAANVDAVAGQIGDLKQRLTAIESRTAGGNDTYSALAVGGGLLIAILGIAASFAMRRSPEPPVRVVERVVNG